MERNVAIDPPLTFKDSREWEAWLEKNGASSSGVWLRLAKKEATQATISYANAVETALCFGWIDSRKKKGDQHFWLQRFTPRGVKSVWSKINREKAETLIRSKRMRPAGLKAVKLAKKDGRWERAYASASNSTIPPDLAQALAANPKAQAFFATLNSQNRYAILYRIQSVKKADTRIMKISQFVEMLSNGELLHPRRQPPKRDNA